jgi:hypothetical protein
MPESDDEDANGDVRRTIERLREENERLAAEREESSHRAALARGELARSDRGLGGAS